MRYIVEFRPLIFNISKRTFIHGYTIHDIQNEGYQTLFNCVSLYNLEKHRFVAYASNSIRNNINDLIKRIKIRSFTEENDALSLHDDVEKDLPDMDINSENLLCEECDYQELRLAINNLTKEEKELINLIFKRIHNNIIWFITDSN